MRWWASANGRIVAYRPGTTTRKETKELQDKQFPPAYKFFQNELRVSCGLVFIGDKLVIPKNMREWVIQVAHGDHASTAKMAEITENVYWPNKARDLERRAHGCDVCFRAGKNLISKLPSTRKKPLGRLPRPKCPNEQIQADFLDPFLDERGKTKHVIVAVDNCSKYIWSKVTKHCSSKSAIKFLTTVVEETGTPKELKTDNATAFTSRDFKQFTDTHHIKHSFCTPYVHNAIGTVERNLRTLQDYMKVYLVNKPNLKPAVHRATLTILKIVSKCTGKTPFESHFGGKLRTVLTNIVDLENGAKDIVENLYDLRGNHLAQNSYPASQLKQKEFDCKYGRSCSDKDLEHERLKRAVSTKFFVVRNHQRKGLESKFEQLPKRTVTETEHTVSDGQRTYHKKDIADVTSLVLNSPSLFQGKLHVDTKFKKIGRTKGGKFGKRGEPGVESDERKKGLGPQKQPVDLTNDSDPQISPQTQQHAGFTSSEEETGSTEVSECAPLSKYRRTNFSASSTGPTETRLKSASGSPKPTVNTMPSPESNPSDLELYETAQLFDEDPSQASTCIPLPPANPSNPDQTAQLTEGSKIIPRRSKRLPKLKPPNWYGPIPYTK